MNTAIRDYFIFNAYFSSTLVQVKRKLEFELWLDWPPGGGGGGGTPINKVYKYVPL